MGASSRFRLLALQAAFLASGFAGLIYESIWTRYLKLLLGHAAFAQTVVLALFLGGMALGAALAGRYTHRLRSPLAAYALAEGLVAIAALVFHSAFLWVSDWLYLDAFVRLPSPEAVAWVKWSVAALMILPQSILLGTTFPLMSAGIIRLHPETSGPTLGMLYLLNSLGAAIGVLVAGFVLVPAVGLPGTLLTAGLINAAVAILVWLLRGQSLLPTTDAAGPDRTQDRLSRLMLWGAALTGAASFFYEIAWIRMLGMVLGASTHAFELMLSAFILGIALGGGWIRKRISRLRQPLQFLGAIQLLMGLLALATLWLYNATFVWMGSIYGALTPSEAGYHLFNLASHSIAMAIMIPVTFCAGMTLPLMTELLLRAAYGERAIGQVYAANTLGSIAGVLLAVHLVMPWLGVHGVMVIGGLTDMALGLVLLAFGAAGLRRLILAGLAGVTATGGAIAWGAPDPARMASSVFRTGISRVTANESVPFHKDGKTATVLLSLLTNGKTDASINVARKGESVGDESTQVLLGALPLLLAPQAGTAAVIGLGSGMTSHVLLASPHLSSVDTVEIEPVMAEAARLGFRNFVHRAFDDPRSRLIFDDAKSYLASSGRRFDIIVSEPSNPWVSGVAALFSREYYAMAERHLAEHGLLVQWLQGYETNLSVLASIVEALRITFPHYTIFAVDDSDLIIVARRDGPAPDLSGIGALPPYLAGELAAVGLDDLDALRMRQLGDARLFDPLVAALGVPANSDYFPWVDYQAPQARFMRQSINGVARLGTASVPLLELLGQPALRGAPAATMIAQKSYARTRATVQAANILRATRTGDWHEVDTIAQLAYAFTLSDACRRQEDTQVRTLIDLAVRLVPYLPANELAEVWQRLADSPCWARAGEEAKTWLALVRALSARNGAVTAQVAERLLSGSRLTARNPDLHEYALLAGVIGHLAAGQSAAASNLWVGHAAGALRGKQENVDVRLLGALVGPPG
jgi:predicted membrane-bound spermidine synthase